MKHLFLFSLIALVLTGCTTNLSPENTSTPLPPSQTNTPNSASTIIPTSILPPTVFPATLTPLLPTPTAVPTPKPIITTILATGDVMLGRTVNHQIQRKGPDYTWPFQEVRTILSTADITLINLENPLIDPCPIDDSSMVFCAPTQTTSGLVYAGIDVVNIANNHSEDHYSKGYLSTIEALETAGIKPSDQDHLVIIDHSGIKFGFLGFNRIRQRADHFVISDSEVVDRIKAANSQVDILIVSFHWGQEYQIKPNSNQINLGHLAIESGADLIIGTHPHVPQTVEKYRGKLIFYSLGNFVFDQMWSEATTKGQLASLTFQDSQLITYNLIPIQIRDYGQPFFPQSP